MINESTTASIIRMENSLREKDELLASLNSDIVFLRSQIAHRDEIIEQYKSIVTGRVEDEKMAI